MASFLASVEHRAYRMALYAVKHRDDALDIVQDAMLQLVQNYSGQPAEQWPPLFHRILQNRITDRHRRQQFSRLFMPWQQERADGSSQQIELADEHQPDQPERLQQDRAMARLQQALHGLPLRQQQAWLLRHWEGLDVKQTARAMGCTEGSVKTHLSRALAHLKQQLAEDWP